MQAVGVLQRIDQFQKRGGIQCRGERQLQQDRIGFLINNQRKYGDVVHFTVGPRRIYQLNNPEHVQYVLVKHADQFQKTPALKRAAQDSIGQGLLTSDGDLHKRQRRLVQPAFHHHRIADRKHQPTCPLYRSDT